MSYNGYTNYETWRVMLEFFEGYELSYSDTPDSLEDWLIDSLREQAKGLALDYALAFVQMANYIEIFDHLKEQQDE